MAEQMLEERVVDLEFLMAELLRETARTSRELREFKDEMREFKEEMREFKDEMHVFKDEMLAFREESRRDRIRMNRQWGELANKMGTLVEDLIFPNLPTILQQVVDCTAETIEAVMPRPVRRHATERSRQREFDGVVVCGDYLLVAESKSSLTTEKIREFADSLPDVRGFFPEFADKKIIGAVASLYVPENLIPFAGKQGILIIGFGRENMELLNEPGFTPKAF
jgi:Sec-independent protein translocase protein TatA